MDRWAEVELLVQIAELGSLSRAAQALQMSNASASRHLSALEERLGSRLVQRNTRRLSLTEAGDAFYRRSRAILGEMREAEAAVSEAALNPTGLLRVAGSLSFCMKHVAPLLGEFTARYPNVSVDIVTANRYYDLIDSGIDVAIRTREFEPDSQITVRRLAETRRILSAAPRYIDRHGRPQNLDELSRHKLLLYTYSNHPGELRFTKDGQTRTLPVKGLLSANDGQVLRAAALDGLGILVQPKYVVYDDLVAGRLIPVLDDWDLPRLSINIGFQTRAHLPAKVRAFVDFLVAQFAAMEYERKWST